MHRAAAMLRLVLCLPLAHSLSFHLEGNAERCIGEAVPAKSLLAGDWLCSHHNGSDSHSATLTIRSPFDAIVFEKHDASGHFAITAAVNGVHRVCIFNNATSPRRMTINIKTALEVSDHSTVAKKEHVDAIEAELDRMRKMAVHVYEEMLYMRTRSETMQATSESMRGRLLWVELVMMCIVMIMGLWQIQYLKRYFQVKKLI
ncbi:hypothetical protein AB1Y20_020880 [Prymnesium parvum]|uniref:GOLD domain-containing protein n=1 Tax=Prymnesium parvum TaxID=97485 RepID=A0AB34K0M7_PRYPA